MKNSPSGECSLSRNHDFSRSIYRALPLKLSLRWCRRVSGIAGCDCYLPAFWVEGSCTCRVEECLRGYIASCQRLRLPVLDGAVTGLGQHLSAGSVLSASSAHQVGLRFRWG